VEKNAFFFIFVRFLSFPKSSNFWNERKSKAFLERNGKEEKVKLLPKKQSFFGTEEALLFRIKTREFDYEKRNFFIKLNLNLKIVIY
jgi:hypothetical protein